ncbi:MAG: hypothetical protein M1286_01545 [Candidatus Marsarchaeota archaeon]|nr:hypothetical protein [Candidatus Marsarchaeota archaeon]
MAKQVPWDEQTDGFVSDIDAILSKTHDISFRSLLLDPARFSSRKDLSATVSDARSETDNYFNGIMDRLKDEQAKLDSEMESATAQYKQIDSVITEKSAAARVPYVRPLFVDRQQREDETILIDRYDESLEAFVGKLVSASNYVADLSATYKQYKLGSWLFSGEKNHVLTLNPPTSPVLAIENSRGVIDGMLSGIEASAGR